MILIEPSIYIVTTKKMNYLIEAFISYTNGVEYGSIYPYLKGEFWKN
jgi:hypothetical protein